MMTKTSSKAKYVDFIEYCESCGEEITEDRATCEKCGTLLCLGCYEQLHTCEGEMKDE